MAESSVPGSDRAGASADADLVAAVALALAAVAATLLPPLADTPLRAALGFGFVLLAPGYALVAALFPGRGARGRWVDCGAGGGENDSGAGGREKDCAAAGRDAPGDAARAALGVLSSVVLAALVGVALSLTVGLTPASAVVALAAVTVGGAAVAARRRRTLAPEERFTVPLGAWTAATRSALTDPETRGDAALNVVLAVVVVVSLGGVAYATAVPGDGERFTEFYLLAEDADGDLVAAGYPTEFTAGEPRSQYVGLRNREGETVSYTVVVQLQRVTVTNDSVRVREREELRRFTPEVAAGETWRRNHTVVPTLTGERLRLTYLLYRGAPPAEPTVGNADQHAYTWIDVSAPNGTEASGRLGR
ncbi:MAG: DUF1616 domain-containing protein [Haloarculaceae archaeon]